jgi:hypothetical protein
MARAPIFRAWPKPKTKLRSWRVSLLRSRAIPLGTARAAEAAAVVQFGLDDEQRKRLAVREEG